MKIPPRATKIYNVKPTLLLNKAHDIRNEHPEYAQRLFNRSINLFESMNLSRREIILALADHGECYYKEPSLCLEFLKENIATLTDEDKQKDKFELFYIALQLDSHEEAENYINSMMTDDQTLPNSFYNSLREELLMRAVNSKEIEFVKKRFNEYLIENTEFQRSIWGGSPADKFHMLSRIKSALSTHYLSQNQLELARKAAQDAIILAFETGEPGQSTQETATRRRGGTIGLALGAMAKVEQQSN